MDINNGVLQAKIRLRKDHERAFKAKNPILLDGEVAIVATDFSGYKIKIGDGVTPFNRLNYSNFGVVAFGKLINASAFALDQNGQHIVNPADYLLYLDIFTSKIYYFDTVEQIYKTCSGNEVPLATDLIPGIMKLHQEVKGDDTEGTVSQAAISEAFEKVETAANTVVLNVSEENLHIDLQSLKNLNI